MYLNGRIFHPFPSSRERALSDLCGIGVLEKALANERSRDVGSESEDTILRESRCLIAAAKTANCLLEAKLVPGTRYSVRTGESEVRMVQSEQMYYKIKNPFAKSHLKRHDIRDAIYEHIVHNILFPEAALQFLGVCADGREARLIYCQNAVRTERRPNDEQIEKHLASMGLIREAENVLWMMEWTERRSHLKYMNTLGGAAVLLSGARAFVNWRCGPSGWRRSA